jgi:hypothetical protein
VKEPAVKILIVEDEKKTGEYLTKGLTEHDVEEQQIIVTGHRQVIAVKAVIGQVDDEASLGAERA